MVARHKRRIESNGVLVGDVPSAGPSAIQVVFLSPRTPAKPLLEDAPLVLSISSLRVLPSCFANVL